MAAEPRAQAKHAGARIAPRLRLSSGSTCGRMVWIVGVQKKMTPAHPSEATPLIATKPARSARKEFF